MLVLDGSIDVLGQDPSSGPQMFSPTVAVWLVESLLQFSSFAPDSRMFC